MKTIKLIMKNVKLFEQFVNERRLKSRDLKELTDEYGYEATMDGGTIEITGENPFGDDNEYIFFWDGENAWTETDMGGAYYHEPVTNTEEFSDAIGDSDNWR